MSCTPLCHVGHGWATMAAPDCLMMQTVPPLAARSCSRHRLLVDAVAAFGSTACYLSCRGCSVLPRYLSTSASCNANCNILHRLTYTINIQVLCHYSAWIIVILETTVGHTNYRRDQSRSPKLSWKPHLMNLVIEETIVGQTVYHRDCSQST